MFILWYMLLVLILIVHLSAFYPKSRRVAYHPVSWLDLPISPESKSVSKEKKNSYSRNVHLFTSPLKRMWQALKGRRHSDCTQIQARKASSCWVYEFKKNTNKDCSSSGYTHLNTCNATTCISSIKELALVGHYFLFSIKCGALFLFLPRHMRIN